MDGYSITCFLGATAYGVPSIYIIQLLWLYVKRIFYFMQYWIEIVLLLYSLECENVLGVFRLCGGDLRWLLAPLKIPSPAGLSWTSLWGSLGTIDRGGNVSMGLKQILNRRPPKNKKLRNIAKAGCHKPKLQQSANHYFEKTKDLSSNRQRFLKYSPVQPL